LSRVVNIFFFTQREHVLIQKAERVVELLDDLSRGEITPRELRRVLLLMEREEPLAIWIVDRKGLRTLDPRSQPDLRLPRPLIEQTLPRILEGKRIGEVRTVDGVRYLTVGVPLRINDRITGAVFLATPVRAVRSTPRAVLNLMWKTMGGVAIFAAVLIYYVSRRIADPLAQVSRAALAVARGDFSRRVAVDSDDEIGQVARSFNYMAAQLERLEQLRRDFIANVSHELRTPLTSLRGFIQGIRDGAVPAAQQDKYLELALKELARLNRLVNDLLDLARLESGNFRLHKEPHDAFELARRTLVKLEPVFVGRNLKVRVDLPEEAGIVQLDPDRFEQILLNLLNNAVRFTPPGGTISLSGRLRPRTVELAVSDTGVGIPPEDLPHIWERFYKGDRSRAQDKDAVTDERTLSAGTGLGLTITKHLIEAHNGTVRVESEPGRGTTFILEFPRHQL